MKLNSIARAFHLPPVKKSTLPGLRSVDERRDTNCLNKCVISAIPWRQAFALFLRSPWYLHYNRTDKNYQCESGCRYQ